METKKITKKGWWGGTVEYEENHFGQKNGQYKSWFSNGNKDVECTYKNGKIHGLYKAWWYSNESIGLIKTIKKDQLFGTRIEFK